MSGKIGIGKLATAATAAEKMMMIGIAGTVSSVANAPQMGTASKCKATSGNVPTLAAIETTNEPTTNLRMRPVNSGRFGGLPFRTRDLGEAFEHG